MLTEFERPISDAERELLLGRLVPLRPASADRGLPGLGGVADLLVTFTLVGLIWNPVVGVLSAVLYALCFILPGYLRARRQVPAVQPAAERQRDAVRESVLAATTARVQRVESDAVVEALGDLVTVYFFDLGDGRTFWHGLTEGGGVDPARWPNRCFELLQVPGSREVFGPFCQGEWLPPRETLEGLDLGELPESGVIDCPLDDFVRELAAR
jgi:hypothetical protein